MQVRELTPDELRGYIERHHEKDYLLIDVRQPGEYSNVHIPGARLMPLPELVQTVDSLPADTDLIFYCHSGGRSAAAAHMAAEELAGKGLKYNLRGGIMAWNGRMVAELPRTDLFGPAAGIEALTTAMNLEKGALRFYHHIAGTFADDAWSAIFGRLAQVEAEHARAVHAIRRKMQPETDSFETVFDHLDGEILEGGLSLKEALAALAGAKGPVCVRVFELALKIEAAAFDLYRSMAHQTETPDMRQAFLMLAQAEKTHMRQLADALGTCPGS